MIHRLIESSAKHWTSAITEITDCCPIPLNITDLKLLWNGLKGKVYYETNSIGLILKRDVRNGSAANLLVDAIFSATFYVMLMRNPTYTVTNVRL